MPAYRSGLLVKFAAIMVALALVPAALLGLQLFNISQTGISEAVGELHAKLAESLASSVDEFLRTNHEKVEFALRSLQTNLDWAEKQELLRSLIDTHRDVVEVSMVDGKGRQLVKIVNSELTKGEALISVAGEPAYVEARARPGKRATQLLTWGGQPALLTYYPMRGNVLARVLVSLRTLGARVSNESFGGTGFAVLVDPKGQPLLYSARRLDAASAAALPRWPIVTAALQAQSIGTSEFAGIGGEPYMGAYAPLAGGGAIITLQSRADAYHAAARMKRTAYAASCVVVLLGLMAAIWQARKLTKPLLALSKGAEAVSRGDFLAAVEVRTGDELQELADTFNRMTAQLRAYSVLQVDRLIAEQRKTEAILYSINDGILMTDKEGRVQHANRRGLELLGLDPQAAVDGKPLADVLPAESKLREPVLEAANNPHPERVKDIKLETEEGQNRFIRVTGNPVRRPSSTSNAGVVVSVRDVTLERELDKMKEEFLHYITHDLRNPVGSAIGFLDLLLKGVPGVLNEEQHSLVSAVKRSNMRLLSMVNNILDIAKMESGRIKLQLKTVSIAGIAGRSIAILEAQAKVKNIKVSLDAAEEFSIEADGDLIERVFSNLLGNALKYTPKEGAVTLSIRDDGANLRCCVADTGDGIPPDYLNRLFQKFEQVEGRRKGGTGLGLAIAKFFVEAHLGRIWVESELDKGSQFYFTLPKTLVADGDGAARLAGDAAAAAEAA